MDFLSTLLNLVVFPYIRLLEWFSSRKCLGRKCGLDNRKRLCPLQPLASLQPLKREEVKMKICNDDDIGDPKKTFQRPIKKSPKVVRLVLL